MGASVEELMKSLLSRVVVFTETSAVFGSTADVAGEDILGEASINADLEDLAEDLVGALTSAGVSSQFRISADGHELCYSLFGETVRCNVVVGES